MATDIKPAKTEFLRDGRAPIPTKVATSRIMSANKAKGTKPEIVFRKAIWSAGVKGYRVHWKKAPGSPDIAFPGKRIAIFIHGCFWHRCPTCAFTLPKSNTNFWKTKFLANKERDERKIKNLLEQNWKFLIVWECEIRDSIILSHKIRDLKKILS